VAVRYALGAPLRTLVVTNIYNDPVFNIGTWCPNRIKMNDEIPKTSQAFYYVLPHHQDDGV
jgi:hypothetical protein